MCHRYLTRLRRIPKLLINSLKILTLEEDMGKQHKSPAIDDMKVKKYKAAAINYPKQLEPWSYDYLFTKPGVPPIISLNTY